MSTNDVNNYEEEEATTDEMESVGYTGFFIGVLFITLLSLLIVFLWRLFS